MCQTRGHGRVLELSIARGIPPARPGTRPYTTSYDGYMMRENGASDLLLKGEQRQVALKAFMVIGKVTPDQLAFYRMNRREFIRSEMLVSLAGPAAETELADGDGRMNEEDFFQAHRAAMVATGGDSPAATEMMIAEMKAAREMCKQELRHAILLVSKELLARTTLSQGECEDIWRRTSAIAPSAIDQRAGAE